MSETEKTLPTTFEKHIEEVSKEREGAINTAMWFQMLSILFPILGVSFLFQYLISIQFDPLSALAIIVTVGVVCLYSLREWQNHITDYLKGREMLILTFRLRRGFWFSDFLLVKEWKLLNPTARKLSQLLPDFKANPHDVSLFEYEVTFEDCPYFPSMVVYSPCPKDDLIQNVPQMVLWKQFITGAQASSMSVVRLKEFILGDEGIIPHVYPTDDDYEAERLTQLAGITPITKGIVDEGAKVYEAVKYMEVRGLLEDSQRREKTLNEMIDRMGDRAAKMATSLAEEAIEAGHMPTKREWGFPFKWFKKHWKLCLGVGVIVFIIFIILYGGYLIGG